MFGNLWVRAADAAWGPYPDGHWNNVLAFARIGARHGGPREVWWGQRGPTRRVRRYESGERTFPVDRSEIDRARERKQYTGRTRFRYAPRIRRAGERVVVFHRGTPAEKRVVFKGAS